MGMSKNVWRGGALVNSVHRDADFKGRVLACLQICQIGDDAPEGD